MSVVVDFSIFPVGRGDSLSQYVARAVKIIETSGLDYHLHPMGTCIEGDWHRVMAVVNQCLEALKKDCDRIYMTIKVDYRSGGQGRLSGKVKSVAARL